MPTTLPTEIFYIAGSIILTLAGLIWNNLNGRVTDIEDHHATMPLSGLREDMAGIKRDVEWIKNLLNSQRKRNG